MDFIDVVPRDPLALEVSQFTLTIIDQMPDLFLVRFEDVLRDQPPAACALDAGVGKERPLFVKDRGLVEGVAPRSVLDRSFAPGFERGLAVRGVRRVERRGIGGH